MGDFFKTTTGIIIAVFVGIFALGGIGLTCYRTYAPAYKKARHEMYRNNTAHVEDVTRAIRNYKTQYITEKDEIGKAAIREERK